MIEFDVHPDQRGSALQTLRNWTPRQFGVAAVAAVGVAVLIGVPTDVIPNPVFGRPVPVTWWSYPTLFVTAVLGGLLAATYVRQQARKRRRVDTARRTRCTDADGQCGRTALLLRRRLPGLQQAGDRGARHHGGTSVVRAAAAVARCCVDRAALVGASLEAPQHRQLPASLSAQLATASNSARTRSGSGCVAM